MATRGLLSPAQRLRLTELPDPMDERDLACHHTLSDGDLRVIGKRRRPETRMGFSVQLCYLRFPGRPLRAGEGPPGNLLEYVAAQLGEAPVAFDRYAKSRDTTRGSGGLLVIHEYRAPNPSPNRPQELVKP